MQTQETTISLIRRVRAVAILADGVVLAAEVIEGWSWSRTTCGSAAVLDPDRAAAGGC